MSLALLAARRGGNRAGSLAHGVRVALSPVPADRLTRSIASGEGVANDGGGGGGNPSSPYMKAIKQFLNRIKPSEGTQLTVGLVGGFISISSGVYLGYTKLEDHVAARAKSHVNDIFAEEKKERQRFQHVATAAHHDFMSKSNESTAQIHREMAALQSEMIALKEKEFKYRQELLLAAELLQRHAAEGPKETKEPGNGK